MALPLDFIRAEFARRAVTFHEGEDLHKIELWGLFRWGAVSEFIKSGKVKTKMRKENVIVWCTPSYDEIESHIKPLILKHTKKELEEMTRG